MLYNKLKFYGVDKDPLNADLDYLKRYVRPICYFLVNKNYSKESFKYCKENTVDLINIIIPFFNINDEETKN